MTDDPEGRKAKAEARARWLGRAMIILLGLLLLAYIIPLFIPRFHLR